MKDENRTNDLLNKLADLEKMANDSDLFTEYSEKINILREELANRLHMEAISWKQKAQEIRIKTQNSFTFW